MFDHLTPDQDGRIMQGGASGITTRARYAQHRKRTVAFIGAYDQAGAVGAQHTYVTGKPPLTEATHALHGAGVKSIYMDGRYPIVKMDDGRQITWAGQFFGDDATSVEAASLWEWLDARIGRLFNGAGLLLTPSTTGRNLWLRTVRAEGYDVMGTEAQDLVRRTSGQGRIEALPRGRMTGLAFLYDARLAYLACTRNLPVGRPDLVGKATAGAVVRANPYAPMRVHCTWQAPDDWEHVGILPMMGDGGGWHWPAQGEGWCDGAELLVAVRHGWKVTVREALVWPERADVFRTWQSRLEHVLADAADALTVRGAALVRRAVRAIALHAIGAFAGRPHRESGSGDDPPAGAFNIQPVGTGYVWTTETPAAWPQMSHPEWTAAIWGRARARLLDVNGVGALALPAGSIIAFRTDAILTTLRTDWDDDGRIGAYRLEGSTQLAHWPRSNGEALTLKRECEWKP